jgi:hypothetical protein
MKFYYYGRPDSNGLSEYLNQNIPNIGSLTDNDTNSVKELLPERNALHRTNPEWLSDNGFDFSDPSYIVLTFLSNIEGMRNSIGYFIYDTKNPPKTIGHIQECYFMFPNSSSNGKGGGLNSGDKIILAYEFQKHNFSDDDTNLRSYVEPTNYIFPSGKSVGFLLYPDGWKGSYVNKYLTPYTSLSDLNPEESREHKYHTACIKLPGNDDKLVLGFEDINRSESSCEHDFNSVMFIVDTEVAKLGKGFTDTKDFQKTDAEPDMPDSYEIGYKKVFANYNGYTVEAVVTLYIPLDSVFLRKKTYKNRYKTNRAYVKQIITVVPQTNSVTTHDFISKKLDSAYSWYDHSFVYNTKRFVTSVISDNDRTGIYYFKTFAEAAAYDFDPYKL